MLNVLSVESLRNLFDFLSQQPDIIFWIRSSDYKQQIYVSPSYESICQFSCDQLYEHPQSFFDRVISHHRADLLDTVGRIVQFDAQQDDSSQMFQMIRPNGELVGFKQTIYSLVSLTGQPVGFAGIGNYLNPEMWHQQYKLWYKRQELRSELDIKDEIFSKLNQAAQVTPANEGKKNIKLIINNENNETGPIDITNREHQCLFYLMQGLSAKEIANKLNISVRTVEFHLSNIKDKVQCRTIIELISRIVGIHQI